MTYETYVDLIGTLKNSSKKNFRKNEFLCIEHLNSLNYKCYCNYVHKSLCSSQVLYCVLQKCKTSCKFCNFKSLKLFKLVYDKLEYFQIVNIFGSEYIVQNSEISKLIISNKRSVGINDLLKIFKSHIDVDIPNYIVTDAICNLSKMNYDIKSVWFELINFIISNDYHLEMHSKLLSSLIVDILEKNKTDIFPLDTLSSLLTDNVLNYMFEKKRTSNLHVIINLRKALIIPHNYLYKLSEYSFAEKKFICSKLINAVDFISYQNKHCVSSFGYAIKLAVNPTKILDSIFEFNSSEILEELNDNMGTFISYKTDIGDLGYDAGGLTKDFFSAFATEVLSYMVELDGFLIPKNENFDTKQMKMIGTLLCRSIFFENISPSLNIHPVFSYLLINGGSNISFTKIISYLEYFEIDFMSYLFKILQMEDSEYINFLSFQDEPFIKKEPYILQILIDKYINKNVKKIVNGFQHAFHTMTYAELATPLMFHKFITKNSKYDILSSSIHSLKNNIRIHYCTEIYFNENDANLVNKMKDKNNNIFKQIFLDVLEELNNENIKKLELFFKFWYGTSSVISFKEKNSSIDTNSNKTKYIKCFESSTCFDKLYITINQSMYSSKSSLKEYLIAAIDSSLKNQELCESIGVYMQQM